MALKMQTYDEPTDTWIDVVSVTQQIIAGDSSGAAIIAIEPLMVTEMNSISDDFYLHGLVDSVTLVPTIRILNPLAKITPSFT